jgi:hypothetical protein
LARAEVAPRSHGRVKCGDARLRATRTNPHRYSQINLLTFPVIIGQGTRLFADTGPDVALDLVDTRSTPSGVAIQVFRPSGRPEYATSTAKATWTKLGVEQFGRGRCF